MEINHIHAIIKYIDTTRIMIKIFKKTANGRGHGSRGPVADIEGFRPPPPERYQAPPEGFNLFTTLTIAHNCKKKNE